MISAFIRLSLVYSTNSTLCPRVRVETLVTRVWGLMRRCGATWRCTLCPGAAPPRSSGTSPPAPGAGPAGQTISRPRSEASRINCWCWINKLSRYLWFRTFVDLSRRLFSLLHNSRKVSILITEVHDMRWTSSFRKIFIVITVIQYSFQVYQVKLPPLTSKQWGIKGWC